MLSVEKHSPAKKAGVVSGDILIKLNETPVTNMVDLHRLLSKGIIGKETRIRILRAEKPIEIVIFPSESGN